MNVAFKSNSEFLAYFKGKTWTPLLYKKAFSQMLKRVFVGEKKKRELNMQ